ncbi:MAG: hypothetical protein M0Q44_01555 [Methylobacter sp.]|nr:hypothetical protein [Methylobacter sp.]
MLKIIMERTGGTIKPEALQISDPFKSGGVLQVAAVFELSDGQTVSIFFHNPDVDPKKIMPTDELISWKWLLNKKDVTIVVAPEKGVDLNVKQVAERIIRLAEKNSVAFQRANASRAAKMQGIEDIKTEITGLEAELKAVQHELEVAKVEVAKVEAEDRAANKADESAIDPTSPEGYAKIKGIGNMELRHQDALDDFFQGRIIAVRNALMDVGWSGVRQKGNYDLSKNGYVAKFNFKRVGAGANVVGYYVSVMGGKDIQAEVGDRLTGTPADVAASVDAVVTNSGQVTQANYPAQESNITSDTEITPQAEEAGAETSELNQATSFDKYMSDADGDLYGAAKNYFKAELQNKVVKTVIGDVHIIGSTLTEMKRGLKRDEIKANLFSFIEPILTNGSYKGKEELNKLRHDSFIAFHFFELDNIEIGEYLVNAGVTVAQRVSGELEFDLSAYGLGHSNEARWKKRIGANPLSRSRAEDELAPQEPGKPVLDSSIGLDNGGVNIVILKVFDKDGNELVELEDDIEQEGHEVVEHPPSESDTGIEQSLIDTYDATYIKVADKITTAVTEINWDAIIDTNTADIEARQLKEKVGNGEEIKQARKNLEDAGIDYQLAVIAELPGLSLYSQAIVNGRDAIDKIYDAGKNGLIKSGKEKLASLSEDATLEEKAAAVFAAKGIEGYNGERIISAIRDKNIEDLRSMLGNTDNKASRTVFEMATGIKLEKTVKGTLAQIDEWVGVTPEQRATIEAEKQALRDADNLLSDLKYAWHPLEQAKAKTDAGIETMQELVIRKFKEGYQRIETSKRGVATAYWMVKSANESIGFKRVKIFNAFLKAALAYGGSEPGGMKKALTALGIESESAALTPVELVNAAYAFNATDDFKEWLSESVDKTEQSPFLTAKAMDEAAKRNGADIEWGFFGRAALDSVVGDGDPDIELIDEDELGATFEPDSDDGAVFDSVILDGVDQDGYVGKISKDGAVAGRIDIGDDGKALVFVGESGDVRVKFASGVSAGYSDDDAVEMIDSLFNVPQVDADIIIDPQPTQEEEILPVIEPVSKAEDAQVIPTGNTEIDKQWAKLKSLAALQERMKAANKIIKSKTLSDEQKKQQLTAAGEDYDRLMKPDFGGRIGYADYLLTNNNAVIGNTRKRIAQLEAQELAESLAASGDRETSYDFDGGVIDLDYGDDRLRVHFDKKPGSDMISKLKQNGFKWSYTNDAWQRQLTDNAISTANYLFGTQIQTAASAMKEEVNKPRGDVVVPAAIKPEQTLENSMKAAFEAELDALKAETDIEAFDRRLDEIAGRIEGAGLMEELDAELNAAADVLTALLAEAEKAA